MQTPTLNQRKSGTIAKHCQNRLCSLPQYKNVNVCQTKKLVASADLEIMRSTTRISDRSWWNETLPNKVWRRLFLSRYSYTSSLFRPSTQHPRNLTRFRCCTLLMVITSAKNWSFPWVECAESLFTATCEPSLHFPCSSEQPTNHFDKFHDVNSQVSVAWRSSLNSQDYCKRVTVYFYFNERKGPYQVNVTKAALAELILHVETVSGSF